MAKYDEAEQHEDDLQSQSLLKNDLGKGDGVFSDDESTVVGRSEPKKDYLHHDHRFFGRRVALFLVILLSILLASTLVVLAWLVGHQKALHGDHATYITGEHNTSQFQQSAGITSCGRTGREAIAAGCHFDTFSFGWTPPECTDLQLYTENVALLFNQTGGAFAFYTPNHDPIPFSALREYGTGTSPPGAAVTDHHEIFTTWEHYLVACAYGWQKVQRAAMRNWPLEEWSSSYALARQCGPDMLTRERRDSESIMSHLRPWFPMCGLEVEQMRTDIEAILPE